MINKIIIGMGCVFVLVTVGSVLGQVHWVLDVLTHLTMTYAAALGIVVLLSVIRKIHPRWIVIFASAWLINIGFLAPYFLPSVGTPAPSSAATMTLMTINVSTSNMGYEAVTDYIVEQDADLVLLVEVRDDLVAHLEARLGTAYPYLHAAPSRWTLGLAWLSKTPFSEAKTMYFADSRRRFLSVELPWQGQPTTFFSVHPLPPLSDGWARSRDAEFAAFAGYANATETPLILAGDFNAVPWAHPIRRLLGETNLRPAPYGFGIWPTWSYMGLIHAPIDFMLISPEWEVLRYELGRDVRSDHVPVVADLRLR